MMIGAKSASKAFSRFDYRFYQSAHPDLRLKGFLKGHDAVKVDSCWPGGESIAFRVPGVAVVAEHTWEDGRKVSSRLNLDGLHIDFRKATPRIHMTWRGCIERCPAYLSAEIGIMSIADAKDYPVSDERGLVDPVNVEGASS